MMDCRWMDLPLLAAFTTRSVIYSLWLRDRSPPKLKHVKIELTTYFNCKNVKDYD